MKKDNSLYFVIPAYNEAAVIGEVAQNLLKQGYKQIVIVNDGSRDNTADILKKIPIVALNHPINRGQGAAIATGIEYCVRQPDCRYIVTFDADGQHRLEDVEAMLKEIKASDVDIVLGSRFLSKKSEKMPVSRKIMLLGATLFLRFLYGLKLSDAHNGLRLFKVEVARQVMPTVDNFVHASEIPYLIKRNRLRYIEMPVTIDYTEYSLSKGQKTSNFLRVGKYTILHKLLSIFFD